MKSLSLSTSGRPPPADNLHDGTSMTALACDGWRANCQRAEAAECCKSFAHELFTFVVQQLKLLLAVAKTGSHHHSLRNHFT